MVRDIVKTRRRIYTSLSNNEYKSLRELEGISGYKRDTLLKYLRWLFNEGLIDKKVVSGKLYFKRRELGEEELLEKLIDEKHRELVRELDRITMLKKIVRGEQE